ncbi:MAG: tRNA (N(6)-L-threonylcarbamoyladenosine(37)-C(2))-methylthiotransferase MtaB [Terriglobia bacterium]
MASFFLINFGCRVSQADGAGLKNQLRGAGLIEAQDTAACDLAILNTCTVTQTADAEVRQIIRRIHRANPQCRIMVTGCYAQRAPEEIAGLEGVSWVVGNSHKHQIPAMLAGANQVSRADSATAAILADEIQPEFHFVPAFADDRTRPTVKIQDGCNARCAFCVIPSVRGPGRSLAPSNVIEEIRRLEQQGFKEIVLSGINLGSYGKDLGRSINFLGILERILAETQMPRMRISSIEPMDISPELIRLAAREPRLARHFHVPLQSGCDGILRLMNRRYWAAHYAERIRAIHQSIPNAAIGADVMVGFPGETAADHAESVRFIESLPLTYLHVFPYSARPSTAAASRPCQVERATARERAGELRALSAKRQRAFMERQVGEVLSAITLQETAAGECLALSTNFLKISIPAENFRPNHLVNLRVLRVDAGGLHGEVQEAVGETQRWARHGLCAAGFSVVPAGAAMRVETLRGFGVDKGRPNRTEYR